MYPTTTLENYEFFNSMVKGQLTLSVRHTTHRRKTRKIDISKKAVFFREFFWKQFTIPLKRGYTNYVLLAAFHFLLETAS